MNRVYAGDKIYLGFFKPQQSGRWIGNIKRYALDSDGTLIDARGAEVTTTDGLIKENALSWWTTLGNDGPAVEKGGVAEVLEEALEGGDDAHRLHLHRHAGRPDPLVQCLRDHQHGHHQHDAQRGERHGAPEPLHQRAQRATSGTSSTRSRRSSTTRRQTRASSTSAPTTACCTASTTTPAWSSGASSRRNTSSASGGSRMPTTTTSWTARRWSTAAPARRSCSSDHVAAATATWPWTSPITPRRATSTRSGQRCSGDPGTNYEHLGQSWARPEKATIATGSTITTTGCDVTDHGHQDGCLPVRRRVRHQPGRGHAHRYAIRPAGPCSP